MPDPKKMFWDSCVFIRYLTQSPVDFLWDIGEFINDTKKRGRTIYYSTLVYAEIKPSHLVRRGFSGIQDLIRDLEGAFEPIDPTPNIFADVGIMRDLTPEHPSKPAKLTLGTPDAIHLATCIHVRDTLEVADIVFHTFDATPGNGWQGKTVPIIGFENWYGKHLSVRQIADVCKLPRERPEYPQGRLFAQGTGTPGGAPGAPHSVPVPNPEPGSV
jgi:predicted nucleic acid-binding protein